MALLTGSTLVSRKSSSDHSGKNSRSGDDFEGSFRFNTHEGQGAYVGNVNDFEDNIFQGVANSIHRGRNGIRRSGRRISDNIKTLARGTGILAVRMNRGLKQVSSVAGRGVANAGQAALRGLQRAGKSLRRATKGTNRMSRAFFSVGASAAKGLQYVAHNYAKASFRTGEAFRKSLYDLRSAYRRSLSNLRRRDYHVNPNHRANLYSRRSGLDRPVRNPRVGPR